MGKYLSNPAYEFSEGINVDRSYAHDGQNKMISSAEWHRLRPAGQPDERRLDGLYLRHREPPDVDERDGVGALLRRLGPSLPGRGADILARNFLYDGDAVIAGYDDTGAMIRRYVWGEETDETLLHVRQNRDDDAR